MQKYFVKKIVGDSVSFLSDDEHHILKVMRYKIGDEVIAISEQGHKYLVTLTNLSPLRAQIKETIIEDTTNPFELHVYQASIKPSHVEIAIQKACELNVNHFYLFNAELSQGHIKHNLSRYEKIIKEACEQSNRNHLMQLHMVESMQALKTLMQANDINLIAHLSDATEDLNEVLTKQTMKVGILVGPEGGLTNQDLVNLSLPQNKIIHLTKTILRSETATIYLCSVVSYVLLKVFKHE